VRPSTGSVGDAYDNALCESFFATLECELLDRQRFRTQIDARLAVFDFIEGWYNPRRRHSALEYLSPMIFERTHGVGDRTVALGATIDQGAATSVSPPGAGAVTTTKAVHPPPNRGNSSHCSQFELVANVKTARRRLGSLRCYSAGIK
jgi:putative transposase